GWPALSAAANPGRATRPGRQPGTLLPGRVEAGSLHPDHLDADRQQWSSLVPGPAGEGAAPRSRDSRGRSRGRSLPAGPGTSAEAANPCGVAAGTGAAEYPAAGVRPGGGRRAGGGYRTGGPGTHGRGCTPGPGPALLSAG